MKPKRLTIIFFSIMMLAATPRAMSHFNNYADALHQKVEAEWLNLLLGFAAPAEIEKNEATPENSHHPAICTKGTNGEIEPATLKPSDDAKATPRSRASKKLSFEYRLTNTATVRADGSNESQPEGLRYEWTARELVDPARAFPVVPVAASIKGRARVEYLRRLAQSTLGGKRKAARTLVRELTTLTEERTRHVGSVPVNSEPSIVQKSELDTDVAEQNSDSGRVSSEESMH